MTADDITMARRLAESSPVLREIFKTTGFDLSSIQALNQLPTSVIKFCAFAANHILAFADKIEELQEALRTMAKGMAGYESRIYELEEESSGFETKIEEQEREIAVHKANIDRVLACHEEATGRCFDCRRLLNVTPTLAHTELEQLHEQIAALQAQVEELKSALKLKE